MNSTTRTRSTPYRHTDIPLDIQDRPLRPEAPRRQGQGSAIAALVCSALALLMLPLVVVPGASLLPPLPAVLGVALGYRALRRSTGSRTWPVVALTASSCALAVTGFVALMWMVFVVDPAIGQYPELHEAVRRAFGG